MSNKASVREIVIEVSGVNIHLTPDQAKELHAELDVLFGSKIVFRDDYWWHKPVYFSGNLDVEEHAGMPMCDSNIASRPECSSTITIAV